ncbi:DUF7716 domain-containing protein [Corallococcus interemptor]|uniref:DUF7716 domain-containing protein n=1 Tax=Corallococcus interemptor TaxID=2316720 RepID=UPI003CFE979D
MESLEPLADVLARINDHPVRAHALYLKGVHPLDPQAPTWVLQRDAASDELPELARKQGLRKVLSVADARKVVANLQLQKQDASPADLVEAFNFYCMNDVFIELTWKPYALLKAAGKSPEEVVRQAELGGMGRMGIFRMVRALFELSMGEMKDVLARAAGKQGGAHENQELQAWALAEMDLETLFDREPSLRRVVNALPGLAFLGIQPTVGVRITPLDARKGVLGLFEKPVNVTRAHFKYEPAEFLEWVRSCFRKFDFSEGICFCFSGHPNSSGGNYWLEARLNGADDLLPLWTVLDASTVLVSSNARDCMVGIFAGEMGWEMFQQS